MNRILLKTGKFLLVLVLHSLILVGCSTDKDWRTASRESAGIAPDPASTNEAVLQVYGAKAWSWRGWFAIHTWIAAKHTGEISYTVYDVVGWRSHHNQPVLRICYDVPDRYWYGEKPRVIKEYRGKGVDKLINAVHEAAKAYPWKTTYKVFPGPNSNTFTGWIAKKVPELELNLPFSAIGSGYAD
jgi:GNAT superfamily N-acetyltransferase